MNIFSQPLHKIFLGFWSLVCLFSCNTIAQTSGKDENSSEWVRINPNGKLIYKTLPTGDKIMDFSNAGYGGGGVKFPDAEVKITLNPIVGDNTEAIQNAINKVAQLPAKNGIKGAVLLRPGTYDCANPINLSYSGVVLRGSGSETQGTVLNLIGKTHIGIIIRGSEKKIETEVSSFFADAYVPSGATTFHLQQTKGFKVGDTISISKPVTNSWVHFMAMDNLERDGKKQTWITGEITTDRVITAIHQNEITVNVPLTDSYDAKYTNSVGVKVTKINVRGMLSQIGIENLRIFSPAQSISISDGQYRAFTMSGVTDAWAKNIEVFNTVNSVSVTGNRITVENLSITHEVPTLGAAKPADLNGSGSQILFNKCNIKGDNLFFFGTGAKVTGPVVLLNCVFKGNGWIQPHQRWATGLLVDNCQVPNGGIDFMNRGEYGSGHGWAIGWAVAWNCTAKSILNQRPPGTANWVIGSSGEHRQMAMPFDKEPFQPEGIYDSPEKKVNPNSLYLAQLEERLGKQAVKNIGY